MQLTIIKQDQVVRVPKKYIEKALFYFYKKLSIKDKKFCKARELTIVFVSKSKIKTMNKQFRGKNKATDILSFDSLEPGSIGELVISAEVLRHQADDHNLKFRDELVYMLYHGVLHLCGYDHEESELAAKKMFSIQDKAFHGFLNRKGVS